MRNFGGRRAIVAGLIALPVFSIGQPAPPGQHDLRPVISFHAAPEFSPAQKPAYDAGDETRRLRASQRFFRLACTAARLRLYPLAMKFFLRSEQKRPERLTTDSSLREDWIGRTDPDELISLGRPAAHTENDSPPDSIASILDAFRDTAGDFRYALLLEVKQPVFRRRKVISGLDNVGHTFITLIRLSPDGSSVTRSFGFYPRKPFPLAATPVFPNVPGVVRNDAAHDWDEIVGRFVSRGRFLSIYRTLSGYAKRRYHLSRNNCTDFGLRIAGLGGICVSRTAATWLFGGGNNPACAGQSIAEGDICNADGDSGSDLFVALRSDDLYRAGKE